MESFHREEQAAFRYRDIWMVKDPVLHDAWRLGGWHAVVGLTPGTNADGCIERRVLGSIVEQIEHHLLEQYGIHRDHGQVSTDFHLHTVLGQDLSGALAGLFRRSRPCRGARD